MRKAPRTETMIESVRFKTYDGVDLAANLYLPDTQEWSPGIIVCHGFGSGKDNYAAFGTMAAAAGYAVLVPDLRGHGESGGELDGNMFNDVAASLQYLHTRPEVNPMGLAIRGTSMGGWLALHTAGYLRDISPVIAYCPASETTMQVLVEEVSMVQRGHASPLVPPKPPRVNVNSLLQLLYKVDVLKAARRIQPRPLLLVHCEGDEVVPAHLTRRLYDSVAEPKTLWLLPGGDHHFAQHDPETDSRVLGWLDLVRPHTENLKFEEPPED